MEKTAEETYTDLLRQLGSPTIVEPDMLVGYLRDVERLHSQGRITDWQLERARSAYAATLERDPRQGAPRTPVPRADIVRDDVLHPGSANLDPISGASGAHPVGAGVGALAGGAAAGAAIGTVAGPVGTVLGAAVGALIGGLAGKGVAEMIDPTVEAAYWRDNYASRPYVAPGDTFDDYATAYGYGVNAYRDRDGRSFDEMESRLSREWEAARGASTLPWERARNATRDAWDRVDNRRGSA